MKKLVVGITSAFSVFLIKGQLKHFSERGYKVYLMAPHHPDVANLCREEDAIHLAVDFRREISPLHDLLAFVRVVYLLNRISPDVVNVGTPKASLLGICACWILGIRKRIYTCRGFRFEHETGVKRRILVMMEKLTGHLASDIICISQSIKSMALQESIFSESKCTVIGNGSSNGVDLSRFNKENIERVQIEEDRKILGIQNRFVFGFVGRLIDRKGIGELIMAFKKLNSNYSEVVLLIVGHAEMDQLTDPKVIEEIQHNPAIISVGWQYDVPRYLSLMQVFVLPAWWEGFGNVLIQAAAMGIPVISTSATGTKDAVKDGYNGILVQPRDVDSLARVMEKYYLEPKLCKLHGDNGFMWARQFESSVVWEGIERIYNGK